MPVCCTGYAIKSKTYRQPGKNEQVRVRRAERGRLNWLQSGNLSTIGAVGGRLRGAQDPNVANEEAQLLEHFMAEHAYRSTANIAPTPCTCFADQCYTTSAFVSQLLIEWHLCVCEGVCVCFVLCICCMYCSYIDKYNHCPKKRIMEQKCSCNKFPLRI